MVHKRFIRRQLGRSSKHATVFLLCVALSVVTLVVLGGFSQQVRGTLLRDARALHAADIIIHSHGPLSSPIDRAVTTMEQQGLVQRARVYEFYSVVRSTRQEAALLAQLKVVESGYPFYGRVELGSKRAFAEMLQPGSVIVEQTLLDRLGLDIGDRLHVGKAVLTIRDVLLREPDQPVRFFALGPRIFIAAADLEKLDLVKKGSRVAYNHLLKVHDERQLNRLADELRVEASVQERVETFRTAESGVRTFLDNFLFFLSLVGILTLLLAGIGIQSALAALLRESQQTIAIIKAVGATNRFITLNHLCLVAVLAILGTLLGLAAGVMAQPILPWLFTGLLPRSVVVQNAWWAAFEGLLLGSVVVGLFAFLPLYQLRNVKPNVIFGKEEIRVAGGFGKAVAYTMIALFFMAMIAWQIDNVYTGMLVALGVVIVLFIVMGATWAILRLAKRLRLRPLRLRQALKGLFRPGNATPPIVVTLTTSLALLFSISLIEQTLDGSFQQAYTDDTPSLFFIDIQASQRDAFDRTLGIQTEYYPVVNARLMAINDQPIDRTRERRRRGDNLSREFHLTYRHYLLEDEAIIAGAGLFRDDWKDVQVSVLDTVVEMQPMAIGDRLTFKIQGIPLEARISSIRTRRRKSIRPFFYFVFPEKVLREAPQTLFTAVRVPPAESSHLQHRMVSAFPNVSVVDVGATLSAFAQVVRKLSTIIRAVTVFSLMAGILLLINSILATRLVRVREAVYFKILGARDRFVVQVLALEHLLLGLLSALLALVLSQIANWVVSTMVLDIGYRPYMGMSLLLVLGAVLLIMTVGWFASRSVLRHRPATFLRQHAES